MVHITNECCDCGLPCRGSSCPNLSVKHYECDGCGSEVECGELFDFDGDELCMDCVQSRLVPVE